MAGALFADMKHRTALRVTAGVFAGAYLVSAMAAVAGTVLPPFIGLAAIALGGVGAAMPERLPFRVLRPAVMPVVCAVLSVRLLAGISEVLGVALPPIVLLAALLAGGGFAVRLRPSLTLRFARARG